MKKIFAWVLGVVLLVGGVAIAQNVSNYMEQGGSRWVIAGSLDVASGGDLDIESGGALNIAGTTVTSSAAELNIMDGVTSTTAELNILDGVTSTAAELNILDGVTATAAEINGLDDSLVFADGLSRVRIASATYDFAVEGGAQAAIGLGVTIPDNAIVLDGMVDVLTTLTSSGDIATIALSVEGADDVVVAVAIGTGTPWDAGLRAIVPDNAIANAIKTTAAREITATIAVENVTAGKFIVHLRYVLSE